jgi:hypothetical protein
LWGACARGDFWFAAVYSFFYCNIEREGSAFSHTDKEEIRDLRNHL